MIHSYIKTAMRSILRNKLFSLINMVGLATSMSAGLLLIAVLHDMAQYDRFHVNTSRMYRVINDYQEPSGNSYAMATASVKAGKKIRSDVSGVDHVVNVQYGFGGDFQVQDKVLPLRGFWTEPDFFNVFSFHLLKGDPETALQKPYSIILTESGAQKLFGNTDVLGKSVVFKNDSSNNFIVTGVLQDVPKFSHLQFDALGSFSTLELGANTNSSFLDWGNIWSNYVYVVLTEGSSTKELQVQLDRLSDFENSFSKDLTISLQLQPLTEITLGKSLENQISPVMSTKLIWFLTGLCFIVLVSACFNYTNLSIARSLKRSKEIGIRKMIGAKKRQVLFQFLAEGVIISLLSFLIALVLFQSIRPFFIALTPNLNRLLVLNLSSTIILLFILFAVTIGAVAGLLPGLFYTRVNALSIVKSISSMKLMNKLTLRKFLLVVQYTFSLVFITSVVIIYSQYQHFLSFNLGFSTENILNIKLQDVKPEILSKALSEVPAVVKTSKSFMITSVGNNYFTQVKFTNPQDSIKAWYNKVDKDYIELFEFKFIAGRNFSEPQEGKVESEVIVNEKLIQRLNIRNGKPEDAIGEIISINGNDLQIVGVLADFHYSTLEREIGPFLFRQTADDFRYVNVKLSSTDLSATMAQIESAWSTMGSDHALESYFYDDMIQRAYNEYSSMMKIIGYLAALTIVIASLGLIGMVIYSTEARASEISIRKVFGARVYQLVFTLSQGFFVLLIVAGAIAIPVTYLVFDRIVLREVVYRSSVGFFEMSIGYLCVMIIALLIIGSQTIKVATTNPAKSLRAE